MIAYKLFKLRKNGTIGPLFINNRQVIKEGEWLQADCYPTKGFKVREGWHVTKEPIAPHLSTKNRIWKKVEIHNYTEFKRPEHQGGIWYLASQMKVLGDI